ncbi:MAG TPA: flavodoxin [Coriobacteriia bacterium]|nr:flavodoxin [Coriobacteriia bacterium]
MRAVVVYESLWGNTAAIARAIAEGIGEGARALPTDGATHEVMEEADLVVAGSPLLGFALPTDTMRRTIGTDPKHRDHPADLDHPSMRSWLEGLPASSGGYATFETRIWWSPGSAAKRIGKSLARAGYRQVAPPEKFLVTDTYGPLKEGELERARAWGEQLARAVSSAG